MRIARDLSRHPLEVSALLLVSVMVSVVGAVAWRRIRPIGVPVPLSNETPEDPVSEQIEI